MKRAYSTSPTDMQLAKAASKRAKAAAPQLHGSFRAPSLHGVGHVVVILERHFQRHRNAAISRGKLVRRHRRIAAPGGRNRIAVKGLEIGRRVLGDEHPNTLSLIFNMGLLLRHQNKYDEAEGYLQEAMEGMRQVLGEEHPNTLDTIKALVKLYEAWEKPEEAQKYRDMLPEEDTPTEDSE